MINKKFEIFKSNTKIKMNCFVFFEFDEYKKTNLLINIPKIIKKTIDNLNFTKTNFVFLNIISLKKMKLINKKVYPFKEFSDVLSIPLFESTKKPSINNPIGEIYICYEKAIQQAKEYFHSIEREFSFLFLHGLLHLLDFNHIKKKDEILMFEIQKFILNELDIKR